MVISFSFHEAENLPTCLRPAPNPSNLACMQWLCAPRGSAFLHVQRRHQRHVRPLILSHGYGSGFVSEFIWDGCRDYAPLLAVSAALHAWRVLGPEAVRAYQRRLLEQAVELLSQAWGTGGLTQLLGWQMGAGLRRAVIAFCLLALAAPLSSTHGANECLPLCPCLLPVVLCQRTALAPLFMLLLCFPATPCHQPAAQPHPPTTCRHAGSARHVWVYGSSGAATRLHSCLPGSSTQ